MKRQYFSFAIVLLTSIVLHANYVERTNLEENIQVKAQHILDTMYGEHNFSVSTTVDMGRESWTVNYTDRADIEYSEKKNVPSEEYKILPGYSAIKNLSPNEAVQMPFNSRISKVTAPIIKITLDVVTSKKIDKKDVKAADKILTKILGLNSERGDSINFVFEDFPVNKSGEEIKVGLPIEAKLMIVVLIITSFFLIIYIVLKMKELKIDEDGVKAQLETAKATASAASSGGGVKEAAPDIPAMPQMMPSGSSDDTGGFFSFVGPHNAAQFVDVIKKNDLPVDQLSMVLSYLQPAVVKMVMDTIEESQQVEIINALTEEKIADKDELDELQDKLKGQLECSVGGASILGGVIATFNDSSKKTFLSSVESNVEIYNKIRPSIFLFEDIDKLDDGDVKKLIGALNIEVLAASIAIDDSAAAKKLTANLTGAADAMVKQFIDLKKESLTDADITNAQNKVVNQMKQLNDQGAIDLVSKLMS
tara:strand:- start:391 stop:1824 length:1434 start_codon:yes stop_codon:yes gene_type:complete